MIIKARSIADLNFLLLTDLYAEDIEQIRLRHYDHMDFYEGRICAENEFYHYLRDCFFGEQQGVYYINTMGHAYTAAVRIEPFKDGRLLNALFTGKEYRRKGCASELLSAVLADTRCVIYSHVKRNNTASRAIHEKYCFYKYLNHAEFIDGSVMLDHITYIWRP